MKINLESKELTKIARTWTTIHEFECNFDEIGRENLYYPELGQSDPVICKVCRKLTDLRVIVDPEWSLAPMDPFPGHADPGVLEVPLQ